MVPLRPLTHLQVLITLFNVGVTAYLVGEIGKSTFSVIVSPTPAAVLARVRRDEG